MLQGTNTGPRSVGWQVGAESEMFHCTFIIFTPEGMSNLGHGRILSLDDGSLEVPIGCSFVGLVVDGLTCSVLIETERFCEPVFATGSI